MPSFFVHLSPIVEEGALDADDRGIAGVYEVQSERDESDPHTITAVLDVFHDHIGIAALDDFEIGVRNEAGDWVYESDNEDDPDPEDMPRATFMGGVNDAPQRASSEPQRPIGKPSP